MPFLSPWPARVLLLLVLGVAAYGAINPRHVHAWTVPPDELEHAVYAFALLLLAAAALPRIPAWILALPLVAAGVGLEALQALGLVAGTYELGDAVSNLVGVAAAFFALWAVETRRAGAGAPRPRRRRRRG